MLIYRNDGNAALDEVQLYRPAEEIQPEAIPQPQPQPQALPMTRKQKARILCRIVLVTALAFFLVARFAVVSQANLNMLEVKSSIKKQQTINGDLEAQLTDAVDFTTVQEKAAALNMDFPQNEQIQQINVISYEDIVEANQLKEKQKDETGVVWRMKEE